MQSLNELNTGFDQLENAFCVLEPSAFYIVIRSRDLYQTLTALNKSSHLQFKWFGALEPDDNSSDRTAESAREDIPEYGAIRFEQPINVREKRINGYNAAFLLGRQTRLVDLALSRLTTISRVCFGLIYSLEFGNNWIIQCLGTPIVVNDIYEVDKWNDIISLHPTRPNSVRMNIPIPHTKRLDSIKMIQTLELELHCNPQFRRVKGADTLFDFSLRLNLDRGYGSSQASTMAVAESTQARERVDGLYFLQDNPGESLGRNNVGMNPWTCVKYIAKSYTQKDRPLLEDRVRLLGKLPANGPFVVYERILEQREQLYLLARYRDDSEPLESMRNEVGEEFSRRLLWNLLRAVAQLNAAGIVHRKINPRTVLVEEHSSEKLFLAGFSQCAALLQENAEDASMDCLQIFETVRMCIGHRMLKTSWTGHSILDRLWSRFIRGTGTWSEKALEICSKLDINLHSKTELWTTIKASKEMAIRYNDDAGFCADDLKRYVVNIAIAKMKSYDSWRGIDEIEKDAEVTLSTITGKDGYVRHVHYESFRNTMAQRHDVTTFFLKDPTFHAATRRSELITEVNFEVPYSSRYGIINVEYLSRIDCGALRAQMPHSIVEESLEVRGYTKAQGIYVSVDHFPAFASALELRFDRLSIQGKEDSSMDKFTYHDYFLIAANESSELYVVDREGETVQLESERVTLAKFLREKICSKSYLDCMVEHDPRLLLTPTALSSAQFSFKGLVEPSEDSESRLQFSRIRKLSSSAGHVQKVEEWVENTACVRRKKRRQGMGSDIPAPKILAGRKI